MKNRLLIFGFILLAGFSCQSKEPKLPDTPLSEQNLKFEIYDSLVVDYLGNLILMDISPDQKHFLLIDQNTDSIFVTDPMGVILNRYIRSGEGPEDYNDTRSGLAKFISNTEFILPATRGMYLYSLAGDLNQKYTVDFYSDVAIVVSNSDNIALNGNKIYTNLSGRYTDQGFEGVEYQQKARKIEVLDLQTGEFSPALPFPKASRFSSETEIHPAIAYYTNLAILDDSLFVSFRNEATIYIYSLSNLDSAFSFKVIPFEKFILAKPTDPNDDAAFRMRDLFVGTVNRVIPLGNGEFIVDFLSGLSDEEVDPILNEAGTDFSKMFEEANKINTAGRVVFDGKAISPIIEKPEILGSLTKFVSRDEIWFALNFSEVENDYSVIYKTRLAEK